MGAAVPIFAVENDQTSSNKCSCVQPEQWQIYKLNDKYQ